MKIERGPYGKIAVIDLNQTLVLHAVEALQNQSCPCFLKANIREQFGQLQICYDCTGLQNLCEYDVLATDDIDSFRASVRHLLLSLLDSLDYCLSPSGILLDANHAWIDPVNKSVYLTYFPIRGDTSSDQCNLTALDTDAFDSFLGHPIISQIVPTSIRQKLVCACQSNDERAFREAIAQLDCLVTTTTPSRSPITAYTKYWIALLFITLIYGIIQLRLILTDARKPPDSISFESLFFLFIPIAICAAFLFQAQNKYGQKKQINPCELKERRQVQADIYFPDHSTETNVGSSDDYEQKIRPAFLIEQEDYGKLSAEHRRCRSFLIWVDDYLIGADKSLCDLYLNDDSISYMHARIIKRSHMYYLVDLGSEKGTWIGHQRLYSNEETPLNENDQIKIGKYRFIFSFSGKKD